MSDIPNTDDPKIAAVAAALEISKYKRSGDMREDKFQGHLERFLSAYQAIAQVTSIEVPDELPTVA